MRIGRGRCGFSSASLRRNMVARNREEDHHGCSQEEGEEIQDQEESEEVRRADEEDRGEALRREKEEGRAEEGQEERKEGRKESRQEIRAPQEDRVEKSRTHARRAEAGAAACAAVTPARAGAEHELPAV
jgi:hypothetical protein